MNSRLRIYALIAVFIGILISLAKIVPAGFSHSVYIDYSSARERSERRIIYVRVESTIRDTAFTSLLSPTYLQTSVPDWRLAQKGTADPFEGRVAYEAAKVRNFYRDTADVLSDCSASIQDKEDAALAAIAFVKKLTVRGERKGFFRAKMKCNSTGLTLLNWDGNTVWQSSAL